MAGRSESKDTHRARSGPPNDETCLRVSALVHHRARQDCWKRERISGANFVHKHECQINMNARNRRAYDTLCKRSLPTAFTIASVRVGLRNQPCTVHSQQVICPRETRNISTVYGGCDYAAGEASFKEKTWNEGRTGVRSCRVDFFPNGGRICGSRASDGYTAAAKRCTGSRIHARRRGNLRR